MRAAPASITLLVALLALAGSGAAAQPQLTPPDVAPVSGPAAAYGEEAAELLVRYLNDGTAAVLQGAALFQERFDQARGIADELVAEGAVAVNRCAVGSALPPVQVPQSSAQLQPDVPGWTARLNVWGDNLSVPLNAEAACRADQVADLGVPAPDPADAPAAPALPDVTVPAAPGGPAIPEPAIPDVALPIPA